MRARSTRCVVLIACITFGMRFMAIALTAPYAMLWFVHNGFTVVEAGMIATITGTMGIISGPLIGGVADAWLAHREVFLVTGVLNACACFAVPAWPDSFAYQLVVQMLMRLTDGSGLVDGMVMRSLAWLGRADLAPRSRATGALTWIIAAPLVGLRNGPGGRTPNILHAAIPMPTAGLH